MTSIINYFAYAALFYESILSMLTIHKMVNFFQIMKFEAIDIMKQFEDVCKLMVFGMLAYGIIKRNRSMVKCWLLLSYCQINWAGVVAMFSNIYEYLFAEKYKNKDEFLEEMRNSHAQLISQVLSQVGIILVIYRYFQSLETLNKIRDPPNDVPPEEKVK